VITIKNKYASDDEEVLRDACKTDQPAGTDVEAARMTAVHLEILVRSSVIKVYRACSCPDCQQRVDKVQRSHAYTDHSSLVQHHLSMYDSKV